MTLFGSTRTHVTRNHALIAPDGYVTTTLPGWTGAEAVMLISPQLGARFTQYLVTLGQDQEAGESSLPLPGVERFVYVVRGEVGLETEDQQTRLGAGGFAYFPPNTHHMLTSNGARLTLFERRYVTLDGVPPPDIVTGAEAAISGEPFLGDDALTVKKLLPEHPSFDLAVNTMTFRPGAALPFVETHIMEHGLLMLAGGGIYRLGESWYPVQQDDVIWMGPYCPQWFGALGKVDAAYLLYKEVNRDPFAFEQES